MLRPDVLVAASSVPRLFFTVMTISVNLSKRPFRNHRAFWMGILAIFLFCAVLIALVEGERARASEHVNMIDSEVRSMKDAYEKRKREDEERRQEEARLMLSDEEKIQLAAAKHLIARRSFSWTGMIRDLTKYIPQENIRVTSLNFDSVMNGTDGNTVIITVTGEGRSPEKMTEFMTDLEKSDGLFQVGETAQGTVTETGAVPFSMRIQYNPSKGDKN